MKTIILFFTFISSPFFHDIEIAKFDVYQENDNLYLNIKFDKEDLNLALKKDKVTKKTIQNYLNKNTTWVINHQNMKFKVNEILEDRLFYQVKCIFNKTISNIKNIEVYNTCLLEETKKHSNIISFQLNGKNRTFRMHQQRKKINVNY